MNEPKLISHTELSLAMDYGTFTIIGQRDRWEQLGDFGSSALLDRAIITPPSASDGVAVLVTTPHQYNFDMPITVELWSDRPTYDSAEWQQVSCERLTIDDEELMIFGSPNSDDIEYHMRTGEYLLEICGRGFTHPELLETTDPDPKDVWRVRAWKDNGQEEPLPATKVWQPTES